MRQLGEFLDRLLGKLLKPDLSLIKNVLPSLAKSALTPLGLTVIASAKDSVIQIKIYGPE